MTVNRFGLQSSVQKIIDIGGQLLIGDRFDGNIQPYDELSERMQIILNGMDRVVASLQIAAVIDDRVG